jgi:hypothetical protein
MTDDDKKKRRDKHKFHEVKKPTPREKAGIMSALWRNRNGHKKKGGKG